MTAQRMLPVMRAHVVFLALAACIGRADAQEPIVGDGLQKVVGRLMERASDQKNLPLPMEVNAERAAGMKIKGYGTVVLPAKGLSKEALSKAGKDVVPVGQLWMARLVPAANGMPLPNEMLRAIKVTIDQEESTLQLLMLGLRKKADDGIELVLFAKGKDPVLTLPLRKTDRTQELPVELDMRSGTESLGLIDIYILGQFQAALPVAESQP